MHGAVRLNIRSGIWRRSLITHKISSYWKIPVRRFILSMLRTRRLRLQPAFTCLKLTIETPNQCVKFVQSRQETPQNSVSDVVLVSLVTLSRFHIFIVEFEQINGGWNFTAILALTQVFFQKLFAFFKTSHLSDLRMLVWHVKTY